MQIFLANDAVSKVPSVPVEREELSNFPSQDPHLFFLLNYSQTISQERGSILVGGNDKVGSDFRGKANFRRTSGATLK